MLALATAILPAMPESALAVLECCNGIMCPMHAAQAHHPDCGMDMNSSGASLKPCPAPAAHYTAAVSFVLLSPIVLHDDARSESAHAFPPKFFPEVQPRVDSPPPRLLLKA